MNRRSPYNSRPEIIDQNNESTEAEKMNLTIVISNSLRWALEKVTHRRFGTTPSDASSQQKAD